MAAAMPTSRTLSFISISFKAVLVPDAGIVRAKTGRRYCGFPQSRPNPPYSGREKNLVTLNAERRREEAAGHVRWLRPEFQNPSPAAMAARFTGKGPWKKRLPQLLETLVALGRVRAAGKGWQA
ncbi:MAG: hypothetical protein PHR30_09055 [Gallionellaceae bacterium]|nr:hypothetical protein [Gallionellaceae bacterium]